MIAFLLLPFLAPKTCARFGRRGERVEALVRPVLEHLLEHLLQVLRFERLDVVTVAAAVGLVEQPDEHLDGAVVVHGAEDVVEVHGAVEEAPRDVAHQRSAGTRRSA